jgi:hypothetical protein
VKLCFYCRQEKCIYQCSLYILFELIIFLFFYIENCVAPSFNWTFPLYNICLEDISKGIWIVKIGMYFLGFYIVSLHYSITFSLLLNARIRSWDFGEYKLWKSFYRFELLDWTPLNISAFAFMQMSMNVHS